MTRTFQTLAAVWLGALLFAGAGCQDKETQEALNTCRNELSNLQKTVASQTPLVNTLKSQLAEAQAKVQEISMASESAKTGKGSKPAEEKVKLAEAKKPDEAKPASKETKPAEAAKKADEAKPTAKEAKPAEAKKAEEAKPASKETKPAEVKKVEEAKPATPPEVKK